MEYAQLTRGRPGRREKVFGAGPCVPLDRNAKVRVMTYAKARNAALRQPRQHRGPITRAGLEVLAALLWGFHNSWDGRCFPSYERIAERAGCCRDTVCQAIKALEAAGVLGWVNRLARIQVRELDLFGRWAWRWRLVRTSNAYAFRDPGARIAAAAAHRASKSENRAGTPVQESTYLERVLSDVSGADRRAAQEALRLVRERREAMLTGGGLSVGAAS